MKPNMNNAIGFMKPLMSLLQTRAGFMEQVSCAARKGKDRSLSIPCNEWLYYCQPDRDAFFLSLQNQCW